jgi:hypothetical protein
MHAALGLQPEARSTLTRGRRKRQVRWRAAGSLVPAEGVDDGNIQFMALYLRSTDAHHARGGWNDDMTTGGTLTWSNFPASMNTSASISQALTNSSVSSLGRPGHREAEEGYSTR